MKLNQLRNFLAVVDAGSLRAAARSLHIAQPAVTRSIQELEHELGVALFERHARGAVPTRIGEALVLRARSATAELARARDEVDQLRGLTHGCVRVALSMVPHLAFMPSTLNPFRMRFPDVTLDIIDAVFATVATRMGDGTIDCYIGPPPDDLPDGLVSEKLFDNQRVIVGRKNHPLANAKSLADLGAAEWITTAITSSAPSTAGT